VGDEFVHVRRVTEADHFPAQPRQLLHQLAGLGLGLQRVGGLQLLAIQPQHFANNFAGLHRTHIRAGEQRRGLDAKRPQAARGGAGALDALGREVALGIGRAIGILAVDGDAMPHKVKTHAPPHLFEFIRRFRFFAIGNHWRSRRVAAIERFYRASLLNARC